MPNTPNAYPTATIVDLAGFQRTEKRNSIDRITPLTPLVSMRQHLCFQSSIEIDDMVWIQAQYGRRIRDKVVRQVRAILDKEFGKLRVYRYRRLFVARHRSVEGLVAGLLRAQFHTHLIDLPLVNTFGDKIEYLGVTLTWGVGRSTTEAEMERLKRRRQKQRR